MPNPGKYAIDLEDLKYALVTADTGTSGPTYGALKDMPAASEFSITFEKGDERTLEGDGGVVQTNTAKGQTKATLRIGGYHPSIVAELFGHVYVASGTTPNLKHALDWNPSASRPFFKVVGRAINNDQGDTHVTAFKCQVDSEFPDTALTMGNWATMEIPVNVYATTATEVVNSVAQTLKVRVVQNETVTAIA